MPSQKSIATPEMAVAPKRQRGRDRVDAILQTATELFIEKGYDAVTMTEIAARSSTAIGSLYRFFPTKEALTGVLLDRYGAHLMEALDAIIRKADAQSPAGIAAELISLVRDLREERSAILPLIDAQTNSATLRQALRDAMREKLAAIIILSQSSPVQDAAPKAIVLQHLLKMAWALNHDDPAMAAALEREMQKLLAAHLDNAASDHRSPRGS